jgi:anaphase-promoting complex subunit 6
VVSGKVLTCLENELVRVINSSESLPEEIRSDYLMRLGFDEAHVESDKKNSDPLALLCLAKESYESSKFLQCLEYCNCALEMDPLDENILLYKVCSLTELKRGTELYRTSHFLVNNYSQKSIAWFAIGCYYYLAKKFEDASRAFSRARSVDKFSAAAWVASGHVFSAQDESEQALAAYRTASRIFQTSPEPLIFMSMEYRKTKDYSLSRQVLTQALQMNPQDFLILNELGCSFAKDSKYSFHLCIFLMHLGITKLFLCLKRL